MRHAHGSVIALALAVLAAAGCFRGVMAGYRIPAPAGAIGVEYARMPAHPEERDPVFEACVAGADESCAEAAARWLAGRGVPRDDAGAAVALMLACERGDGPACGDLAALYAAGRGVRRDDGRACELGLADACARVVRPVPATLRASRIPVGAAPQDPPRDEVGGGLLAAWSMLEYAGLFVDERDREALGLTRNALQREPPAPEVDAALVAPLLAARRAALATCFPPTPSGARDVENEIHAHVSVAIAPDGRASDVRAAGPGLEVRDGAVELAEAARRRECVSGAASRWEFPRLRAGGRAWVAVHRGPAAPEHGDPARSFAAPLRAVLDDASAASWPDAQECLRTLGLVPRKYGGGLPSSAWMTFTVGAGGTASEFRAVTPLPVPVASAIRDAVQACSWSRSEAGAPAPARVLLSFRLEWATD